MLYNDKVAIYQAVSTFEHGEVSTEPYEEVADFYCHLKFTGNEQMSADRKKEIRRAKINFEYSPIALAARDVLYFEGVFYRLLYTPMPRRGNSARPIYETEIIEAFDAEVS